MATNTVPVSPILGLHTTSVKPTQIALAWNTPVRGTPPIHYSVFYRKHGSLQWLVGATSLVTSATVSSLKPSTRYDFEIFARN